MVGDEPFSIARHGHSVEMRQSLRAGSFFLFPQAPSRCDNSQRPESEADLGGVFVDRLETAELDSRVSRVNVFSDTAFPVIPSSGESGGVFRKVCRKSRHWKGGGIDLCWEREEVATGLPHTLLSLLLHRVRGVSSKVQWGFCVLRCLCSNYNE